MAGSDEIGIELKRDFTNSKKHRLIGQITDYQKEFPCVIIVAYGISNIERLQYLPSFGNLGNRLAIVIVRKIADGESA